MNGPYEGGPYEGGPVRGARGSPSAGPLRARPRPHERARTRSPRPLARALEDLATELSPASVLGRVQTVWGRAFLPVRARPMAPNAARSMS